MQKFHLQIGFSLIELIVAITIFAILISGVTFLALGGDSPFVGVDDKREQERFAREALEALEVIKEQDWNQIADNATEASMKITQTAPGAWSISAGTETRGSFTRDIKIYKVERDSSDVIVASGETDDPSTKKVVVTISGTGIADYVVETYLTNWESFRMLQTDWTGTASTQIWTEATSNYFSSTSINGMSPSGMLRLSSST